MPGLGTPAIRLLRAGQRSPAVADLQLRLGRLGFEIAPEELGGSFGSSTEGVVRAFQQQRGLDVDGIVGPDTWKELVESGWALGDRVLYVRQPYFRGDDVRDLQERLNALGFSAGKHDGIFGPQTASALSEFQRNLGIAEDAIVGRETVLALERLRLVTRTGLGPRIREREARRAEVRGLAGKRIAIDPGHGGDDLGELGVEGRTEAEAAFALGARLARLLDLRGATAMLTRGPHDGPSDSERAQRTNDFRADLLISIHFNGHASELAEGVTTYYFERDGVASEPGEHLAQLLQERLVGSGRVDCRTHGKAYPILRETRMPAVVVEPCFITNPKEAAELSDETTYDRMAEAMLEAVEAYFSDEA